MNKKEKLYNDKETRINTPRPKDSLQKINIIKKRNG